MRNFRQLEFTLNFCLTKLTTGGILLWPLVSWNRPLRIKSWNSNSILQVVGKDTEAIPWWNRFRRRSSRRSWRHVEHHLCWLCVGVGDGVGDIVGVGIGDDIGVVDIGRRHFLDATETLSIGPVAEALLGQVGDRLCDHGRKWLAALPRSVVADGKVKLRFTSDQCLDWVSQELWEVRFSHTHLLWPVRNGSFWSYTALFVWIKITYLTGLSLMQPYLPWFSHSPTGQNLEEHSRRSCRVCTY